MSYENKKEALNHGYSLDKWMALSEKKKEAVKWLFTYWKVKEKSDAGFWQEHGEYNVSEMVDLAKEKEVFSHLSEEEIEEIAEHYINLKEKVIKKGGNVKQNKPQYKRKDYGSQDKKRFAKPAGYRYKKIERNGRLRDVTKDDKEYYQTPTQRLIRAYEDKDNKLHNKARKMIYFENRADHSDKQPKNLRKYRSGGDMEYKGVEITYDLSKVPNDIWEAIYFINSRFGDETVKVTRQSDGAYLMQTEDGVSHIFEEGIGAEGVVWEYLDKDARSYTKDGKFSNEKALGGFLLGAAAGAGAMYFLNKPKNENGKTNAVTIEREETWRDIVRDNIDKDGFEYAFLHYSQYKNIDDKKFHKLRKAYVDVAKKFINYIEKNKHSKYELYERFDKERLDGLVDNVPEKANDVLKKHISLYRKARKQLADYIGEEQYRSGGNVDVVSERVEKILPHYVYAALWSTTDEEDNNLDEKYDIEDIDEKTLKKMIIDIYKFITENEEAISASGMTDEQLGHDLWLTRNGHGAGFWDRGYDKEISDKLTKASEVMGGVDLYVGDDGKIHAMGVYENGGLVGEERMYNFLKDDLEKLEKAIAEGDKEEVERFFSYWNHHLKSLKTATNDRMYNFLKDDLEKLEKAIAEGDKEEVERFFSYWNHHLKSIKMIKGGGVGENLVIKDWYTKNYPDDDLGKEIDDTNTFKDMWVAIHNGDDVYSLLGVGDSVIRERVFEKLSEINGVEYDYVYNKWLSSDTYANGGKVGIDFQSNFNDIDLIKEDVMNHVAEMVEQGYTSGELIGEEPEYKGWWNIDIEKDDNDEDVRNSEVAKNIRNGNTSGYYPTYNFSAKVWSSSAKGGGISSDANEYFKDKFYSSYSSANRAIKQYEIKHNTVLKNVGINQLDEGVFEVLLPQKKSDEKYSLGGDIKRYKSQLISKAQKSGIYENFGEAEVRKLKDKYDYFSLVYGTPAQRQMANQIDSFSEWAASYDGREFKHGGSVNTVRCNNCEWEGTEDELILLSEKTDEGSADDFMYYKGCPNCETDDYLMDFKKGGSIKQNKPQYKRKDYGSQDKKRLAKPAGYRYKKIERNGRLRDVTKDDKEYYQTPTQRLIRAYEDKDNKLHNKARKMIYFEDRADHSDKQPKNLRKYRSGGNVDSKSELINKINDFIDEWGGVSLGEIDKESIILEKDKKDEEWMIEYIGRDGVFTTKYVHGQEVASDEVPYADLSIKKLKEIVQLLDEVDTDLLRNGGNVNGGEIGNKEIYYTLPQEHPLYKKGAQIIIEKEKLVEAGNKKYWLYKVYVEQDGQRLKEIGGMTEERAKEEARWRKRNIENLFEKATMSYKYGGGFSEERIRLFEDISSSLMKGEEVSSEALELYLGRKPDMEINLGGLKVRKCFLKPSYKMVE